MPTQHLNLDHPALHPPRVDFALHHGLLAMAAVLGLCGAGAAALQHGAAQARQQAAQLQAVAAARPLALAAAPASAPLQAEIDQLRRLAAGQQRVQAALDAGAAGQREGYTDTFVALARQAQPALWITGLTIGADTQELTLEGRALAADALAPWLKRLNAEPRFKGRPFAQLQLRRVEQAGTAVTEFNLRAVAVK